MKRSFRLLIGGLAVSGLILTGCNSSSGDGGDSTNASTQAESSGDFCTQAKEMSDRYLASIQEQIASGETPSAEKQKELTDQVVGDLKKLGESMPDEASDEVRAAYDRAIKQLESGDTSSPSEQAQKDDALVSQFMSKQCPELAAGQSSAPSPAAS